MAVSLRGPRTDAIRIERRSWLVLSSVLLLVCIVGLLLAFIQNITAGTAAAVVAAITIEAGFYLVPGFADLRGALGRRFRPPVLAFWMTASAVLPYSLYALCTGQFQAVSFAVLASLAAVASFWYVCLPKRPLVDLAFVCLVAGVVLSKVFGRIYTSPAPGLRLEFLGQLMWIRVAILEVLSVRGMEGTGFGFLPRQRDWKIGFAFFAAFLPVGLALSRILDFASFQPRGGAWWMTAVLAAGTFAGMLWVVALSEEFFFRGLLQQWLGDWLRRRWAGLIVASILFGLVHLPFRQFPNWRFAILAAVAGLFYGGAYQKAGSIRAAMVTHALVNTVWRVLLS